MQHGLPGVLSEEAPLPSEVVLEGGILQRRLREAHAGIRDLLLDRPDDIDPGKWRVVQATLAPPSGHLPRSPGTAAKQLGVMQAARECFPGLSPSQALRRYREAQEDPVVRAFVADFRALEMLDIFAQRGLIRECLHATIRRGSEELIDPNSPITPRTAPREWAVVSMAATTACKTLIDMDDLHMTDEERAVFAPASTLDQKAAPADVARALQEKVAGVAAHMRARRAETAGA